MAFHAAEAPYLTGGHPLPGPIIGHFSAMCGTACNLCIRIVTVRLYSLLFEELRMGCCCGMQEVSHTRPYPSEHDTYKLSPYDVRSALPAERVLLLEGALMQKPENRLLERNLCVHAYTGARNDFIHKHCFSQPDIRRKQEQVCAYNFLAYHKQSAGAKGRFVHRAAVVT